MTRKLDSELIAVQKEISRQIRKQFPTASSASFSGTFVGGGGTGGGVSGGGGTGGATVINIVAYGVDGATVGTTTLVARSQISAAGMVWIEDDPSNTGVIIRAESIQDPMTWALMGV